MVRIVDGGDMDDEQLSAVFAQHGVDFDPARDMTAENWSPKVRELVAKANGGTQPEATEFPVHPKLTPLEIKEGTFGTPEWAIAVKRDALNHTLK